MDQLIIGKDVAIDDGSQRNENRSKGRSVILAFDKFSRVFPTNENQSGPKSD